MDTRNRVGLYGAYFLGMAGIGFTLPYLPLYLGELGLSDRAIGIVSTLAALSALAQFPIGLWSDRAGSRKPFVVVALALVAAATWLLRTADAPIWVGLLVILFAENGVCRAVVECLTGAEAAALAPKGGVGAALGALRFWKPIGIVVMALAGSYMAEQHGVRAILTVVVAVQALAVCAALLIHERRPGACSRSESRPRRLEQRWLPKDQMLWTFIAAMILFHAANAPAGVYLGLFFKRDLHAPDRMLAYAVVVSMAAWMLVVWPAGRLADRWGRRPLLVACWAIMALRLALVAVARTPTLAVATQVFDGIANGLFAVLAAAWVTDRLNDRRRAGEAQVIVGCSLVLGSAIGPMVSGFLVGPLGYRGLFVVLAALGALATLLVAVRVPETVDRRRRSAETIALAPISAIPDLSATR